MCPIAGEIEMKIKKITSILRFTLMLIMGLSCTALLAAPPFNEEPFVSHSTITLLQGEFFKSSASIFTVPADKTLVIEYINAFNANSASTNGQETRLTIAYPLSQGFPIASTVFRTTVGSVPDAGGAKVYLPVGPGITVQASIVRKDASSVINTYRITVAGRLLPAP